MPHTMQQRFPLPIPFGWFGVAFSRDLAVGEVKSIHYFGRDLVLFRTETGQARVLDAYCPHLGAHLGHGGSVVGESIACPFHGWQFNGDGFCTSVPYATQKPPRAVDQRCIRHYPTVEDNLAIWVWYHPHDEPPHWELDHVPEIADTDFWTETVFREWIVNCHIQDTNENAVDKAHFVYVHTSENVPIGEVEVDGHRRTTVLTSRTTAHGDDGALIEGEYIDTSFTSKSAGPGFTWQHFRGVTDSILLGIITPINNESIHMRFLFKHPQMNTEMEKLFNQGYIDNVCSQVEQDIGIWNHKIYRADPMLCDGDGPISQFRKWFQQFYAEEPDQT
jgi:3-ketosteroid 9alpha-monooxygenase subunit A